MQQQCSWGEKKKPRPKCVSVDADEMKRNCDEQSQGFVCFICAGTDELNRVEGSWLDGGVYRWEQCVVDAASSDPTALEAHLYRLV